MVFTETIRQRRSNGFNIIFRLCSITTSPFVYQTLRSKPQSWSRYWGYRIIWPRQTWARAAARNVRKIVSSKNRLKFSSSEYNAYFEIIFLQQKWYYWDFITCWGRWIYHGRTCLFRREVQSYGKWRKYCQIFRSCCSRIYKYWKEKQKIDIELAEKERKVLKNDIFLINFWIFSFWKGRI